MKNNKELNNNELVLVSGGEHCAICTCHGHGINGVRWDFILKNVEKHFCRQSCELNFAGELEGVTCHRANGAEVL